MQSKAIRIVSIAAIILFSFMLGAIFGFREGQVAFYMTDALPRGTLSMGYLKALEKGNDAPLRLALNMDINQGLYYYSMAQDAWWFPLYKFGVVHSSYPTDAGLVQRLANYRKLTPGLPENPAMFDKIPAGQEGYADEYAELAVSHKDRLRRIGQVIERYSSK